MLVDQIIETEVFKEGFVVVHGGLYSMEDGKAVIQHQWKIVDPKKWELIELAKKCGFKLPYERDKYGYVKVHGQREFEVAWIQTIAKIVLERAEKEIDITGIMRVSRLVDIIREEEKDGYEFLDKELSTRGLSDILIAGYYYDDNPLFDASLYEPAFIIRKEKVDEFITEDRLRFGTETPECDRAHALGLNTMQYRMKRSNYLHLLVMHHNDSKIRGDMQNNGDNQNGRT